MLNEKDYWNSRYQTGNSGYGSYGEQLVKKVNWLRDLEFDSITDVGCGDFNFSKNLLAVHPAKYQGFDISDVVVDRNNLLYLEEFNILGDEVPPADLVLCLDVLFHIYDEKTLEKTLKILEKAWTKYLAITAYERDEEKSNHVRIRKFDYKRFGEPVIRKIVEEDGELYFYLFKR